MAIVATGDGELVRVPRRFVVPEDRRGFVLIGLNAVFVGGVWLADPTAAERVWVAPLWSSMILLGGLITLAYAADGMRSFRLRAWSGGLLVVGYVGRGAAMTLGLVNGTAHSWQSALGGWGVLSVVGFLLYFTWRSRVPAAGGADALPR